MEKDLIRCWMPLTKSKSGDFMGILSDTSIDRDGEFMTKELLNDWAKNKVLPALANHENKMEKFIGGWKNLRVIQQDGKSALVAEPFFFSKEANPLAAQIKKQVEESLDNGLNPGISIGAIPKETIKKEINGVTHRGYSKAEIVEATIVPVQSNRNATFMSVAKSFNFEKGVVSDMQSFDEEAFDKCVESEVRKGTPYRQSMSMCRQAQLAPKSANVDLNKSLEENKMSEENVKKESPEEAPVEEAKKEVEAPVAEVQEKVEVPAEEVKEDKKVDSELEKVLKENADLKKQVEEISKKAILRKGAIEGPVNENNVVKGADNEPITVERMLKANIGGK